MGIECISGTKAAEFQCKPRPGCHMAHCDPNLPGFVGILQRNEYPITCIRHDPGKDDDFVNRQDYNQLLIRFTKLERGMIVHF